MMLRTIFISCLFTILWKFGSQANPLIEQTIGDRDLSYASEIILDADRKLTFNSPKSALLEVKNQIIVRSKSEKEYPVTLFYNNQRKIKKLSLKVTDLNGKEIKSYKLKEFRDISAVSGFSIYEDARLKLIDLKQFALPFMYEIAYTMEISGISLLSEMEWKPQRYNEYLVKARCEVTAPMEFEVLFETYNNMPIPERIPEGKMRKLIWTLEERPAIPYEIYSPSSDAIFPIGWAGPGSVQIDKYQVDLTDWKTFGQFVNQLAANRQALSTETKEKVKELTEDLQEEYQKVEVLFDYLSGLTRYVSVQLGIGGWQPFEAAYVEKNKYGDCKALSNFMMALLAEAGIESYLVVTYLGDRPPVLPQNKPLLRFNHMILYIPSLDWWVDCTGNEKPCAYPGRKNSGRQALVLTPEGGKLQYIPNYEPMEIPAQINLHLKVLEDGHVNLSYKARLEGSQQERIRLLTNQKNEEQRKRILADIRIVPDKLEGLQIEKSEAFPVCELSYTLHYNHLISRSGHRLFMPVNPISHFWTTPPEDEDRKNPIWITDPYMRQEKITIEFPPSYYADTAGPEGEERVYSEFGTFYMKWKVENNLLQLERTITIDAGRFPAEKYTEWRAFIKDLNRLEGFNLSMKKT